MYLVGTAVLLLGSLSGVDPPNHRRPNDDAQLRAWLQNMVWHHRFNEAEVADATGLTVAAIESSLKKFNISAETKPKRGKNEPLLMLPYPGGRHPRIGFLEGAVRPQRETKISVFTPWDDSSYVVVDVPEAIWSNLGLTYLAHTHVPTIWTKQGIELDPLEWNRRGDGALEITRRLPNGIAFGAKASAAVDSVRMELWLTNGTKEALRDLRVQTCVMLKGAKGFERQTNDNKVISSPYIAVHTADKKRWVVTAWDPVFRCWGNAPCPCLHSDPKFPDCPPGETRRLKGWLSFYEGKDVEAEFKRIEQTGWRTTTASSKVRPATAKRESVMQATKPSDKEIVLTRRFAAPRESVFAALTQKEHLARWMMTAEMTLVACEVDLRVGGKCRYVYQRPNGKKLEVHGAYESVDPPRGFAYAETYDFSPLKVHVTTTLEPEDGGTIFKQTLRYASKQERDEDFPGVASSSKEAYARLEQYLPQIKR